MKRSVVVYTSFVKSNVIRTAINNSQFKRYVVEFPGALSLNTKLDINSSNFQALYKFINEHKKYLLTSENQSNYRIEDIYEQSELLLADYSSINIKPFYECKYFIEKNGKRYKLINYWENKDEYFKFSNFPIFSNGETLIVKPNRLPNSDIFKEHFGFGAIFINDKVRELFVNEGLTGYTTKPIVLQIGKEFYQNWHMLYGTNPILTTNSNFVKDEFLNIKIYGQYNYDRSLIQSFKDFNYLEMDTSTNLESTSYPTIVSKKVLNLIDANKISGIWEKYTSPIRFY
jgi:hypothetical protein